jgi:hypothetical protein
MTRPSFRYLCRTFLLPSRTDIWDEEPTRKTREFTAALGHSSETAVNEDTVPWQYKLTCAFSYRIRTGRPMYNQALA